MERVIQKLQTTDKNKKLVAEVLIKQCESEPAFIGKILNDKKSLNDCWEYIKHMAKKEAVNGTACIDDSVVYGWAIHYFDEEELEDWKKPSKQVPSKQKAKTTPLKTPIVGSKEEHIKKMAQEKVNAKVEESLDDDDEIDEDVEENESKPVITNSNQNMLHSKKQPKGVAEGQLSLF